MALGHKCECGSRTFFEKPISITCDFGGVVSPSRDFKFFNCVRCNRSYVCGMAAGKKSLIVAPEGAALERLIMQLAVDTGYFEDAQGHLTNTLLTDAADQKDIDRLCLDVKEGLLK